MSAFGRVIALIGLILIGFGLFTPVRCPPTGCRLPDDALINTNNFDAGFADGLTASTPAVYIVTVSLVILLAMFGGYRFAMFTAAMMLLAIIILYLIGAILEVTQEGSNLHLGWGWSLLVVGGVILLIAALPKSDRLLEDDEYDDYYPDEQPPMYGPPPGMGWQQPPYPPQTMSGMWGGQPPPQQPPQQPMMMQSGMVAGMTGMYGTNVQPQPLRSSAMPTPQVPQRPRMPAQPPPDPLRKTEPDLLNRERASADSRQMARSGVMASGAQPSVPSPSASRPLASPPAYDDRESTNEFATPQPIYQTPSVGQASSAQPRREPAPPPMPEVTGAIRSPSPASPPRAVDESSQALIRTLISEDSKTIVPDALRPSPPSREPIVQDATEPERNVESPVSRRAPTPPPTPIPAPPSTPTPVAPAPTPSAARKDDEVDLMRASGMIRVPKSQDDVAVDRMQEVDDEAPPEDASLREKTTRAFGKSQPVAAPADRAAFLLNPIDAIDEPDTKPPSPSIPSPRPPAVRDETPEKETQSFGKPTPPPATDRADFLLTAAPEPVDMSPAASVDEDDANTFIPQAEEDDSLPFGVPVLEESAEEDLATNMPMLAEDDSQPLGVPVLDDSHEEDEDAAQYDTDAELEDMHENYATIVTPDEEEDTGPYGVPMPEEDDDDEDDEQNFRTFVTPE